MVSHVHVADRVRSVIGRQFKMSTPGTLHDAHELKLAGSDAGLVTHLEREFNIQLTRESVEDVQNVGELVRLLEGMIPR